MIAMNIVQKNVKSFNLLGFAKNNKFCALKIQLNHIRSLQIICKENNAHLQQNFQICQKGEGKVHVFLKRMNQNIVKNKFIVNRQSYGFTSSSNPTQISLLQEVEAKVFQIIKRYGGSLFSHQSFSLIKNKTVQSNQNQNQNKEVICQKFDKNTKFSDQGFDSLDVTEMVVAMEELFGIDLTDQQARSIQSARMAIDIFFTKINARVMNKIIQTQEAQSSLVGRANFK